MLHPANPPSAEEIVAVIRGAGGRRDGVRLRGLMVVLWRSGLRISEALALAESDLDWSRGAILVRRGRAGGAAKSAWIAGPGISSRHGSSSARAFRSKDFSRRLVSSLDQASVRSAASRQVAAAVISESRVNLIAIRPLIIGALIGHGDGTHRLPVRAALRKTLGKEAGDTVHVRIDERIA